MEHIYIDVKELLGFPGEELEASGAIKLGQVRLGDETIEFVEPFIFSLTLRNVNEGIVVEGWAKGVARLTCGRCLQRFEYGVKARIAELAVMESGAGEEAEEAFRIEEGRVDLAPITFQNVVVDIPMQKLCHDDCAGLCGECGKNLNDEPHTHDTETVDERLKPLKDYFKKSQSR